MTLQDIKTTISTWTTQDFKLITKYITDPSKFKSQATKFDPIIKARDEMFPGMLIAEFLYIVKTDRDGPDLCPTCGGVLEYRTTTYSYPKFCSRACRPSESVPNSLSVIIDGVEYKSVAEATKILGVDRWIIDQGLIDINNPNYRYKNNHEEVCLKKIEAISPKLLDKQFLIDWKENNRPIKELCEELDKHYSTLKLAFLYHGVSTEYDQTGHPAKSSL